MGTSQMVPSNNSEGILVEVVIWQVLIAGWSSLVPISSHINQLDPYLKGALDSSDLAI